MAKIELSWLTHQSLSQSHTKVWNWDYYVALCHLAARRLVLMLRNLQVIECKGVV